MKEHESIDDYYIREWNAEINLFKSDKCIAYHRQFTKEELSQIDKYNEFEYVESENKVAELIFKHGVGWTME